MGSFGESKNQIRRSTTMETRVCGSCKHLFHYITGPVVCPKCRTIEDEKFKVVKEYLRRHPGANLPEIHEETGVDTKLILRFIRDERLEIASDSPIALSCESCGRKILTGIRCSECESKLIKGLNQMKGSFVSEQGAAPQSKMRFLAANQYRR